PARELAGAQIRRHRPRPFHRQGVLRTARWPAGNRQRAGQRDHRDNPPADVADRADRKSPRARPVAGCNHRNRYAAGQSPAAHDDINKLECAGKLAHAHRLVALRTCAAGLRLIALVLTGPFQRLMAAILVSWILLGTRMLAMRLVAVLRFTPRLAAGIIVAALFAGLGAVTMRALPVLR